MMGTNVTGTETTAKVSAYAEMHKQDWILIAYDENIYNPAGYDRYVWDLYRPFLINIVQGLASTHNGVKYLDFACGTGRIIAAIEHLAHEAVGVDISQQMIDYARAKVTHANLLCGDILDNPEVVDSDYDLITAFRFFLNTEPEMRTLVMRALSKKLADSHSCLIFNVHANGWSADGLQSIYRQLRGWPPCSAMTYPQVRRLVEDAGLTIETWYGFGLWPHRFYRSRLSAVFKRIDHWAAHVRPFRWVSHDLLFVCRPKSGDSQGKSALQQ